MTFMAEFHPHPTLPLAGGGAGGLPLQGGGEGGGRAPSLPRHSPRDAMRLLSNWTDPWLSHLPAGLLFASVVLRSALTYGGTPALLPILGVLAAWVVLFAVQGAIARQWAPSFHVYLA